jgi:hypothetical protein
LKWIQRRCLIVRQIRRRAVARSARRRTARNNYQVTNASIGLITRQYRENLRSASGDRARVACSSTSQYSPRRAVGLTRTLNSLFVVGIVERLSVGESLRRLPDARGAPERPVL